MGCKVKEGELRLLAIALEAETPELLSNQQKDSLYQSQALLGSQESIHWPLEFPQVFLRTDGRNGGFNVMIGNPPFLGGLKISGELGSEFLKYIKTAYAPTSGTADLCAYFFRLAFENICHQGYIGMVATNTIAQGDTRETGLAVIVKKGGVIVYVSKYVKWGGDANVEVNLVGIHKQTINISENTVTLLDDNETPYISSLLDDFPEAEPSRLVMNNNLGFIGEVIRGIGFVLSYQEANELIKKSLKNQEILKPYLIGKDLDDDVEQLPSRLVICFEDWPIEKAREYPDLLSIAEQRVKPDRMKLKPITSDYKKYEIDGGNLPGSERICVMQLSH